ncbi:MAG: hypothetical protein ABH836_00890 [Candidatus Omnitrophota bacterium]
MKEILLELVEEHQIWLILFLGVIAIVTEIIFLSDTKIKKRIAIAIILAVLFIFSGLVNYFADKNKQMKIEKIETASRNILLQDEKLKLFDKGFYKEEIFGCIGYTVPDGNFKSGCAAYDEAKEKKEIGKERYQEALNDFQQALENMKERPEWCSQLYLNIGLTYYHLYQEKLKDESKSYECEYQQQAIEYLKESIKSGKEYNSGRFAAAYKHLAKIYAYDNKFADARELMAELEFVEPNVEINGLVSLYISMLELEYTLENEK